MLNLATLTLGVKTAFVAGGADPASPFTLAIAQGIAQAVITEITDNAEVDPGTTLIAPGGMSPAPVTGTAKVK